jgi:hypothetical protein
MRCGCLIWNGAVNQDGFPFAYDAEMYKINGGPRSMVSVRRWVWQKVNGPIPAGRVIVLGCRNRLCVEETHMKALTNGEARAFAAEGGAYQSTACKVSRVVNGRRRAKLDIPTTRVAAGERRAILATEYGVDSTVIDKIISGLRYAERMAPNASVFHQAA